MFDIGFSELMILAVVALVVIGPERLPKVARTVGHLMGRFQRYVGDVKSDIDRELRLDEMKKLREEVEMQARNLQTQVSSQVSAVQSDIEKPVADIAQLTADGERIDAAKSGEPAAPAAPAAEPAGSGPVAPPPAEPRTP